MSNDDGIEITPDVLNAPDPQPLDGDSNAWKKPFEYGAPWTPGAQTLVVLWADEHRAKGADPESPATSIKFTLGGISHDGVKFRLDSYLPIPGRNPNQSEKGAQFVKQKFGQFCRVFGLTGKLVPRNFEGRFVRATLEVDKNFGSGDRPQVTSWSGFAPADSRFGAPVAGAAPAPTQAPVPQQQSAPAAPKRRGLGF